MSIPHPKFDFSKKTQSKNGNDERHLNHQKCQSYSKISKIHPEINTVIKLMKENSKKNIFLSPIDKIMTTMKRNLFIKNDLTHFETFKNSSDNLLKNPYISEGMKNRYSALYLETFSNGQENKDLIHQYYKRNDDYSTTSRANESIQNKKQEIYSLLTKGKEYSIPSGKKEGSIKKPKENCAKINLARLQFEKMLTENESNNKKSLNTKPKMKYFIPIKKTNTNIANLTQRNEDKRNNQDLNEFLQVLSRNNSKKKKGDSNSNNQDNNKNKTFAHFLHKRNGSFL